LGLIAVGGLRRSTLRTSQTYILASFWTAASMFQWPLRFASSMSSSSRLHASIIIFNAFRSGSLVKRVVGLEDWCNLK